MFGTPNQFKKQINQVFNKPDMDVNHAVWLPGWIFPYILNHAQFNYIPLNEVFKNNVPPTVNTKAGSSLCLRWRQADTCHVICKLPWLLPRSVCAIIKTLAGMRKKKKKKKRWLACLCLRWCYPLAGCWWVCRRCSISSVTFWFLCAVSQVSINALKIKRWHFQYQQGS